MRKNAFFALFSKNVFFGTFFSCFFWNFCGFFHLNIRGVCSRVTENGDFGEKGRKKGQKRGHFWQNPKKTLAKKWFFGSVSEIGGPKMAIFWPIFGHPQDPFFQNWPEADFLKSPEPVDDGFLGKWGNLAILQKRQKRVKKGVQKMTFFGTPRPSSKNIKSEKMKKRLGDSLEFATPNFSFFGQKPWYPYTRYFAEILRFFAKNRLRGLSTFSKWPKMAKNDRFFQLTSAKSRFLTPFLRVFEIWRFGPIFV